MRLTVVAITLLSLVLAEAPASCGPVPAPAPPPGPGAGGDNPADSNCHLWVSSPPRLYGTGHSAQIRANVRATCQVPPPRHHLHLTLEFDLRRDFHWVVQSAGLDENLIPDSAGYERTVIHAGCIPGPWRVKAEVDGTRLDGKTPFKGTLNGQSTTIHTCPGP